jgi:hypothetical protein
MSILLQAPNRDRSKCLSITIRILILEVRLIKRLSDYCRYFAKSVNIFYFFFVTRRFP